MSAHDLMTSKQVELLRALAVETLGEDAAQEHLDTLRTEHPRPTQEQASAWIADLKDRKAANPVTAPPRARGGLPSVAAGRYAVPGEAGDLRHYKVDRPATGRFAGYTFVTWERDDGYESPLKKHQVEIVLRKIAANPMDALVAYGLSTGTCGVCSRKLTNPESVEAGIGPVCSAKVGRG